MGPPPRVLTGPKTLPTLACMQPLMGVGNGRMRRLLAGAVVCGLLSTALVADPVLASGRPPVANADTTSLVSGASVTVSPLTNDTDPEGDPITPVSVTAPPNRPPVAQPDAVQVPHGGTVTLDPRVNDSDPDGDRLTVSAASTTTAAAGTVAVEGGVLVIRAKAGYAGPMAIAYTISDGRGGTAHSTVTATIQPAANRAPVARPDRVGVKVRKTISIPVLANDTDPDKDALRLVSVSKPSKGKAWIDGSVIRFKAPKKKGTAVMTYRVADARGAVSAAPVTVRITKKAPKAPKPPAAPSQPATGRKAVEAALARLGMPVGTVNGTYDAKTRRAVCAWRTATGRKATRALPSAAESKAILAARGLPRASSRFTTGVTVSVTCQAAFWVGKDRTIKRVMAASTGKAGYRTRLGDFRVFRAFRTWRYSTIYPEARMYKPLQFSGGQAIHGSATDRLVKTYPASHGCVRMLHKDIDALHRGGVWIGSKVRVIGRW